MERKKQVSYVRDVKPILDQIPRELLTGEELMKRFPTTKQQAKRWLDKYCEQNSIAVGGPALIIAKLLDEKQWSLNVAVSKVVAATGLSTKTVMKHIAVMKSNKHD